MNWSLLAPLVTTTFLAMAGWFVAHRLSTARDRENKKRDLRLQYLIEAYRRLEAAGNRPRGLDTGIAFESAIADNQLFGTLDQVRLARRFALDFARDGTAQLDPLLDSLRQDLSAELRLAQVPESITYLRILHDGHAKGDQAAGADR